MEYWGFWGGELEYVGITNFICNPMILDNSPEAALVLDLCIATSNTLQAAFGGGLDAVGHH